MENSVSARINKVVRSSGDLSAACDKVLHLIGSPTEKGVGAEVHGVVKSLDDASHRLPPRPEGRRGSYSGCPALVGSSKAEIRPAKDTFGALLLHRQKLGKRFIEVHLSSEEAMEDRVRQVGLRDVSAGWIRCRGLPFQVSGAEVAELFQDFGVAQADVIMSKHSQGSLIGYGNGEAFVKLQDQERRLVCSSRLLPATWLFVSPPHFFGPGERRALHRALHRATKPAGPLLPSEPMGVPWNKAGGSVTVELFLDLCCPFSKRMLMTVAGGVAKAFEGKVNFIFHSVVQPWHAQSSYMHEPGRHMKSLCLICLFCGQSKEASLAVLKLHGRDAFWKYTVALMEQQEDFFDDKVFEKSRQQIYKELAIVAHEQGFDDKKIMARLHLTGLGNAGNAVTQHLKWATRFHRLRGVHVTPTVFVNGLEARFFEDVAWEYVLHPKNL
eukprot:g21255.t1